MTVRPLKGQNSQGFKFCHDQVELRTQERLQFIDLTDLVAEKVRRSGITHGVVNVQTRHTTTGVLVNEKEPLLLHDLRERLERWAPQDAEYRHNDLAAREDIPPDERLNGDSHVRAILLRTSETINIVDGKLQLGRWQSIFLIELDGRRKRSVSINVMGLVENDDRPRDRIPTAVAYAS